MSISYPIQRKEAKMGSLYLSILVVCVVSYSCLASSGYKPPRNEVDCLGEIAQRNSTYSNSSAIHKKPLIPGRPLVINLLHSPTIYGYLGDSEVPGYKKLPPFSFRPSNDKWRVVCKMPSQIILVVLSMEVEGEGEYLQVRRKMLHGTNNKFHAYNFKKNSILIGQVKSESTCNDSTYYPFRLLYFCIRETDHDLRVGLKRISIAEKFLLSRHVLKYLQTHQEGIEKLGALFQSTDLNYAMNNHNDNMLDRMIELAYLGDFLDNTC